MGLPKSLIKKYGITKKAWSVYRGRSKARPKTKRKKVKTMARRRRRRAPVRRSRSRRKSYGLIGTAIGAMLYGALRQRGSDLIQPITSRIPAGEYADEVGMGLLSYALARGKIPFVKKIPMSRDIGKAGLVIESARVGSGLMSGANFGGNGQLPEY